MRHLYLLVVLGVSSLASANDAYWVKVGGAGHIGKSADVRMISEHVQIKLFSDRAEVRVDFEFKNDGPEQEVSMAFPESVHDYKTREATEPIAITRFKSRIDAFETPIARQSLREPEFDEFAQYAAVWIKQVKFGAGQTRRVSVEYSAKMNGPSEFGSLDYILKTGSSWKGKIRSCIITVDWTSLRGLGEPDFWADGEEPRRIKGRDIAPHITQFSFKNLEPDFNLSMMWLNNFWNYRVNGERPPSWWEVVSGGPASDPWIEINNVHALLASDGEFEKFESVTDPSKTWDVPIRGRKLQFPDSKAVLVDSKRVPLKRPLVKSDWERRVRVKDLVQALGGTFRYSERETRVYISLPD